MVKRVTVEFDYLDLNLHNVQTLISALVALEKMADEGLIEMSTVDVKEKGALKLRKRRSDAKSAMNKTIQPQMKRVRDGLLEIGLATSKALAENLGENENSVRAQLIGLAKLGLVEVRSLRPKVWVTRPTPWPAPIGGLD